MTTPENEGTASSSLNCQPEGRNPAGDDPGPLLTPHAALVLLAAAFAAAVIGALTFLSAGNAAAAVLAGLTGGAVSAPALHRMIGR